MVAGGRRATSAGGCCCGRARSTCTLERNIFNRAHDIAKGRITNDVTANYIATFLARVQAEKHTKFVSAPKPREGFHEVRTSLVPEIAGRTKTFTSADLLRSSKSQKQRKAWPF